MDANNLETGQVRIYVDPTLKTFLHEPLRETSLEKSFYSIKTSRLSAIYLPTVSAGVLATFHDTPEHECVLSPFGWGRSKLVPAASFVFASYI